MVRSLPSVLLLLAAFAVSACRSAAPASLDCTLVMLHTGPRTEPLEEQERREVFAGHFANMRSMAKEGKLLLAGPFGSERSDAGLRGLFVLDTADLDVAREWAASDPGAQAGVFALGFHALRTDFDLRAVLAADLARLAAAEAEGRTPPPGQGARGYAMLTAADGTRAATVLAGQPFVVCAATLDDGSWLAWLDAADAAAARTQLAPFAERLGEHRLDDWYGSDQLAALAGAATSGGGR